MASSAIQPPSQDSSQPPSLSLQSTAIYFPCTNSVDQQHLLRLLVNLDNDARSFFPQKHPILRVDIYRIECNTSTQLNPGQPNTYEYILNVSVKNKTTLVNWESMSPIAGFLEEVRSCDLLRQPAKQFELAECDENALMDILDRLRREGVCGIKKCDHLVVDENTGERRWKTVFEEGRGVIG